LFVKVIVVGIGGDLIYGEECGFGLGEENEVK
jgi:hypothetical protein